MDCTLCVWSWRSACHARWRRDRHAGRRGLDLGPTRGRQSQLSLSLGGKLRRSAAVQRMAATLCLEVRQSHTPSGGDSRRVVLGQVSPLLCL